MSKVHTFSYDVYHVKQIDSTSREEAKMISSPIGVEYIESENKTVTANEIYEQLKPRFKKFTNYWSECDPRIVTYPFDLDERVKGFNCLQIRRHEFIIVNNIRKI